MRNKIAHIILVFSFITIWFLGSIGGNVWHVMSSHFCYESLSFTIEHHSSEACHSTCCQSPHGDLRAQSSSCDDCAACSSSTPDGSCFNKEASDIQVELIRNSNLIIAYEQIKQLCIEIFNTETSYQTRQWHSPPLLCYSSRHLLSMYAVLII